jgi:predicted O-methyltransferase YrrM
MLSGHVQGKLLEFISTLMQPKYILEIGTFTGYSAICLAKGLQPDGELHTIELRTEDANICSKNFERSRLHKKIHLHVGNALDIIPKLPYLWDLVFIDADKPGYITYYEMVIQRLNNQGLIIADNVLFHGQVLEEPITGKSALAIDAFNRHVAADERTEQLMVTVRDGLLFIKKKK